MWIVKFISLIFYYRIFNFKDLFFYLKLKNKKVLFSCKRVNEQIDDYVLEYFTNRRNIEIDLNYYQHLQLLYELFLSGKYTNDYHLFYDEIIKISKLSSKLCYLEQECLIIQTIRNLYKLKENRELNSAHLKIESKEYDNEIVNVHYKLMADSLILSIVNFDLQNAELLKKMKYNEAIKIELIYLTRNKTTDNISEFYKKSIKKET